MKARIAIIGGGIGGLTCAIALRQRGFEPMVYEQTAELGNVGAGIWLPSNAMQVMSRLGIADDLMAAGFELERIELCDRLLDKPLQTVGLATAKEKFGYSTISILRSELQRVLVEHVGTESLQLDKRCARVLANGDNGDNGDDRSDGDMARVEFEDGTSIEADVVIGADGIRSIVREAVEPGVKLRYAGQTCYRGIAEIALPEKTARTCRETWGGRARFGYSVVASDRVYWFAALTSAAGGADTGPVVAELTDTFQHYSPLIADILAATDDSAVSRLDLYDFAPIERWHRGRVVLLGDAAHAMTPNLGQGGAQAIEDALALARCLEQESDLERAFAALKKRRYSKVRRLIDLSWRLGKAAHYENALARRLRNWVIRATPASITERQVHRMYALD